MIHIDSSVMKSSILRDPKYHFVGEKYLWPENVVPVLSPTDFFIYSIPFSKYFKKFEYDLTATLAGVLYVYHSDLAKKNIFYT